MSAIRELQAAAPGTDAPAAGDGPSLRRLLVPVRSPAEADQALAVAANACRSVNGVVRLVHVRTYDPPVPRCPNRFYAESVADATALLDEALVTVWAHGVRATTAVVDAPRGDVAVAIAWHASTWRADLIVLTRRPRPAVARLVLGSVPDQVMRRANCPVLTVHPRSK